MIKAYTGLDTDYVVIGLAAVCALLVIVCLVLLIKQARMKKRLKIFMEGKNATSLEDTLIMRLEQIDELIAANNENERNIEVINKRLLLTIDKFGLVKYDALEELGGKLSYALALLDDRNNGVIFNNMHGREGSYSYIKEVINGNTVANLSDEEKEALDKAISGRDR